MYFQLTGKTCRPFILLAAMLAMQNLQAAAFYLSEIGSPGSLGTGGAANPTNTFGADSAWTNPAGMTGLDNTQLVAGFQGVIPKVEFDPDRADAGGSDGGNAGNIAMIPSMFYVNKLTHRARLGLSVVAPMGGGVNYGDDFVGRYSTYKAELAAVGVSPSFGFKLNDSFSVGAGVSFIYTMYEQGIAINADAILPGTPDAKIRFDNATDWGYQPFAGLTWQMSERALLGVVYRAKMDVNLKGDINIRNWELPVPRPSTDDIDISWDNPQWLDVGLRYKLGGGKNHLFLNGGWQEWSEFSENGLEFDLNGQSVDATLDRKWDDTWYARIGLSHEFPNGHAFAMGLSYDSSPVKDRYRTFDLPVDEYYKVSATYAINNKSGLDFSLGATLLLVGDAEIHQESQGVTASGEFDKNYILMAGGTIRYEF